MGFPRLNVRGYAAAIGIDDLFAVLLGERAALRGGQKSSTASEGRQSFTPSGVTTMGRLIRMGCAIIASINWSSLKVGIVQAQRVVGRAFRGAAGRAPVSPCGERDPAVPPGWAGF